MVVLFLALNKSIRNFLSASRFLGFGIGTFFFAAFFLTLLESTCDFVSTSRFLYLDIDTCCFAVLVFDTNRLLMRPCERM